jgi:hypothetical protein
MKNTLLVIAVFFLISVVHGQRQPSLSQIQQEKDRITDSLMKGPVLDSLQKMYESVSRKTRSYRGIYLGTGLSLSDISQINKALASAGWNRLADQYTEFGLGFTRKINNWVNTLSLRASLNNKTSSGQSTMTSSEGAITYTLGYEVLHLPWVSAYPFAGIFYQDAGLHLDRQGLPNDSSSRFFGNLGVNTETSVTKSQLRATAGGEVDVHLLQPIKDKPGLMLSVRYGYSWTAIDGRYRANKHPISSFPGRSIRDSYWEISLHFLWF